MASECYVAHTAVRHRYLVLELLHGKLTIWMRLDRRRSLTNLFSFFLSSSQGLANDTVRLLVRIALWRNTILKCVCITLLLGSNFS